MSSFDCAYSNHLILSSRVVCEGSKHSCWLLSWELCIVENDCDESLGLVCRDTLIYNRKYIYGFCPHFRLLSPQNFPWDGVAEECRGLMTAQPLESPGARGWWPVEPASSREGGIMSASTPDLWGGERDWRLSSTASGQGFNRSWLGNEAAIKPQSRGGLRASGLVNAWHPGEGVP